MDLVGDDGGVEDLAVDDGDGEVAPLRPWEVPYKGNGGGSGSCCSISGDGGFRGVVGEAIEWGMGFPL